MARSNKTRMQTPTGDIPQNPTAPPENAPDAAAMLQFIVPTEVVDLPSKGAFYPEGHPLHQCGTIELRHMTAKEEDILTSATLLKKGLALDKMLQSVIVDKSIKVQDLLVGDKNALLVHSRIFGYGPDYTTTLVCEACGAPHENTFNLENVGNKEIEDVLEKYGIETTENNTFCFTLPKSQYEVEYRLLTSRDETEAASSTGQVSSLALLEAITVSLNGQTDRFYIKRALSSLPILDASILKRAYGRTTPDIDLTQEVTCPNCGETADVGVPLDAGFFWPQL